MVWIGLETRRFDSPQDVTYGLVPNDARFLPPQEKILEKESPVLAPTTSVADPSFIDRRGYAGDPSAPANDRRQFTNSHDELSSGARELAIAIDQYKLHHRRRFITYEEMLSVIMTLGYHKDE